MIDVSTTNSNQLSSGLFADYRPLPTIHDEMVTARGETRPHWRPLAGALAAMGLEELKNRWEQARRLIRDHGVTYNVYGDPSGMDRHWELEPVPLLISPIEWTHIEAGLSQRTRLFNLILKDLYGPQRLLYEGILPPALVYSNPRFLRVCRGLVPEGQVHLNLQASDLARSENGKWWVLSDRTQAPSGAGYALENRIVLSRVLPEEFRDCRVHRLASFFRTLREHLHRLARQNRDNPNIVLLTPGPHNETYFEHAYLARYLGLTLVEGGDLTVRNARVFIKTLEGLQPVDVILRRVDDTFCDPLELRDDSFLGVAGLVESIRAGNVTIANALGSGLLESPAFLPFLPGLCRHLLSEEIILPSVATWWCGQETELDYVCEHIDSIVIKPAFAARQFGPFFGERLNEKQRAELIAAIRARPQDYVGQEQVQLSTTPVWKNDSFAPRPLVMRGYVSASKNACMVMPGGLARVSTTAEELIVSMQSGGGSKDVWVLSDTPVARTSLLNSSGSPIHAARITAELPSRVADHLFWVGRYTERLEDTVRLLRCVVTRAIDDAGPERSPEIGALVKVMIAMEMVPAKLAEKVLLKDIEEELLKLVYSPERVGGLPYLTGRVRGIASVVRDRCSIDTWSVLNRLRIEPPTAGHRVALTDVLAQLNDLIVTLGAFGGMEMENMTRGLGWRFLDLGRRLERASHMCQLIRTAVSTPVRTTLVLEPLLEIADSVMTHRRRYYSTVQLTSMLELLLMDESNPRAVAFQLASITAHVMQLPNENRDPRYEQEKHRAAALLQRLKRARVNEMSQAYEHGFPGPLDNLLSDTTLDLGLVSSQICHLYFSHTVARIS